MIDLVDSVTQPLPVTTGSPILQRFVSEDRLYTVMLTRDLFGDWVLMQAWGGRFNARGGGMSRPVENFEAGLALLTAITKRRQQRGYQLVE